MTLEHRDITPVKRPEHAGEKTHERVKTYLFFDLIQEALESYADAKGGKLKLPKSELHDLEFFFKKAWDKFAEPILEYDDLMGIIEKQNWESKGAKSRAKTALDTRKAESETGLREVLPEIFEMLPHSGVVDQKKLRQALARLYEGYASYVKTHQDKIINGVDW